jgi:hypothetical protein
MKKNWRGSKSWLINLGSFTDQFRSLANIVCRLYRWLRKRLHKELLDLARSWIGCLLLVCSFHVKRELNIYLFI